MSAFEFRTVSAIIVILEPKSLYGLSPWLLTCPFKLDTPLGA